MDIRDQINRFGYRKTVFDILLRIAYRIVKGQIFCCLTLPSDAINDSCLASATLPYSVEFIGLSRVLPLIRPKEMTMTHAFAEQAFAKGDKCYGVCHENKLVQFIWAATSPTNVVGNLSLQFGQEYVYLYNSFTDPEVRGKRLYTQALKHVANEYFKDGYKGALAIIAANNYIPLYTVDKIGFTMVGKYYVSSIGRSYVYPSKGCVRNRVHLVRSL